MQILLLLSFAFIALTLSVFAQDHSGTDFLQRNTKDNPSPAVLEKRQRSKQATFNLFQWPRIDGPPQEFPTDDAFETGYWTFNLTFIQRLLELNKTDHLQAQILAYQASVEYELSWRDECFKLSNVSAIMMQHQNTLARVLAFPHEDKKTNLDKVYQLAPAIKLLCMERPRGANINKSIVNHSKALMDLFGWDKETAQRNIKGIHQHLNPTTNKPASSPSMNAKPYPKPKTESKSNRKPKTTAWPKSNKKTQSMPGPWSSPWQQSMPQSTSPPGTGSGFKPGSMPKQMSPPKYKSMPKNKW